MKLYAFTTPEIAKHAGYLKIGETNGSIDKRVDQECHELNVQKEIVWRDAVITERSHIDKIIHRYLVNQGFHIQQFDTTGQDTEWVKCTVADIEKAFDVVKQQIYNEDKREKLSQKFYEELRNWYYWAAEESQNSDYVLRIIVRLLLVFFLREKGLIPACIFDENFINENLKENEYRYYKVIIRNLFFYSLNTPINERKILENESLILHRGKIREQFHKKIPFLNGGLFTEHTGDDFSLNDDYFFSAPRTKTIKELGGQYPVSGIIHILSQYKYTLDETDSSEFIDPEFIGKIFECLLACIDANSKESRRKVTGSYYTPREIVNYMVDESLNTYLEKINDTNIENALLRCQILDPACGSGAFPCGIMNAIMQRLDPNKKLQQSERYQKKLEILRNVIYGVDLQPMAVQIAMLRLFLSLLQEIQPDPKADNFGIDSLPNLDYKFVAADTLIGIDCNSLFFSAHKNLFDQIIDLKRDFFKESNTSSREHLKERIQNAEQELARLSDSEDIKALCEWNHSDTVSSPYFDSRWMFGVEKFDIVIGNPPYVESRSASVSEDLKEKYQKQIKIEFSDCSHYITQGSDLLIYFFPRSITLLSDSGTGMLIVQNGWLNTDYGARASQFLMKVLQYIKITDSTFRHFDKNAANVNTVIVKFKKQSEVKQICFDVMGKNDNDIIEATNEKSFNIKNNSLSELKWGVIMSTSADILSVLKAVIDRGKTIDQSFYTIGQGINVKRDAFISKGNRTKFKRKENLINAVFKENQYIYTDFDYFLYHFFVEDKNDIETLKEINAEELNGGKTFVRKYPSVIMPRGIGDKHFAGLLTVPALSNSFVDIYFNTPDEENQLNIWLFCNSSLFFLYREISGRKNLGGGLLKSEATDIKSLPLYFPITNFKKIRTLFSKMGDPINLQSRLKTSIQQEIDKLVFDYFGFSVVLQNKIISELSRLFEFRDNKAKSNNYTVAGTAIGFAHE
jgi:hypothetical protein